MTWLPLAVAVAVGRAALLDEVLTELVVLFCLLKLGSELCTESGVMDPLVPDRSICLLPPLCDASVLDTSSSGEPSGEQAVTF